MKYEIDLRGERSTEPRLTAASLTLEVEAESREEAEEIVRSSLPGFDWSWRSGWGVVERKPEEAGTPA